MVSAKRLGEVGIGHIHRIAHAHVGQVLIEDVALHPDRAYFADEETGGLAGLNHESGGNQLLHHRAIDGRAHGELGIDRVALFLGVVDFALRDAEDFERLQAVLNVGHGVVVVGHGVFEIL